MTPGRLALGIVRRVWSEVRRWQACFEEHPAEGRRIDPLERASSGVGDIASPALESETRRPT
jgi:hypothetical protein